MLEYTCKCVSSYEFARDIHSYPISYCLFLSSTHSFYNCSFCFFRYHVLFLHSYHLFNHFSRSFGKSRGEYNLVEEDRTEIPSPNLTIDCPPPCKIRFMLTFLRGVCGYHLLHSLGKLLRPIIPIHVG